MAEPDNFTFFVYGKGRKPWACSRKALEGYLVEKEIQEKFIEDSDFEKILLDFSLHEGSVQEGVDKFVKEGGILENDGYRLKADKIFYKDPKVLWKTRNVRFDDYVKI